LKEVLISNSTFIGPMSNFEVFVPENSVGSILSLLSKLHSRIISLDVVSGNLTHITGSASAERLLGFTSSFRNLTKGMGSVLINTSFTPDEFSEL
jgi:translation elongation factor EF-G